MTEATIYQTYDRAENIVFVTFPVVHLDTQDQIRAHFDVAVEFWRTRCGSKPAYCVVCYDGFSVNLRENAYYAEQMRRILPFAITIVRYGGDSLQRTAARLYSMKLHAPSHLYESREQALEVVRALHSGKMRIDKPA